MMISLTRQQRCQMKRLAERAKLAVESDRRFSNRRPKRTYRLRLLSGAERQQAEIILGKPFRPVPDQVVFVAMKQPAPCVRLKAKVIGPREIIGEELSDAEAGSVFEGYADNGAIDPPATASAVTRGVSSAHYMSLRNVQTAIR